MQELVASSQQASVQSARTELRLEASMTSMRERAPWVVKDISGEGITYVPSILGLGGFVFVARVSTSDVSTNHIMRLGREHTLSDASSLPGGMPNVRMTCLTAVGKLIGRMVPEFRKDAGDGAKRWLSSW